MADAAQGKFPHINLCRIHPTCFSVKQTTGIAFGSKFCYKIKHWLLMSIPPRQLTP